MNYIHFILFTVFTNAAAQIMLKYGMTNLGAIQMVSPVTIPAVVLTIFKVVFNPWVFAGLLTFVISMASHLYVLTKVELSFAYPFLSLAYVIVAVIAWLLFAEDMNSWRVAGIGLICIGTVLIAQGGTKEHEITATTAQSEKPQQVASIAGE